MEDKRIASLLGGGTEVHIYRNDDIHSQEHFILRGIKKSEEVYIPFSMVHRLCALLMAEVTRKTDER